MNNPMDSLDTAETPSEPESEPPEPVTTASVPRAPWRPPLVPIVIAMGVTLLLLAGQSQYRRAASQTQRVALGTSARGVTVYEATATQFRPSRRYVGTLEPWLEARVGPQIVSAYVSSVHVRPGAVVHRGEVIATLDCREAHATSQAVAQQARALSVRGEAMAREASRVEGLLDGGFVAPNEVEQREAESRSEQAQLLATQAQLLGSALAVSDCVLRAPFDGEVGERSADPGAFVRPGGAIVSLVDRSIVRVTADVPETDFGAVAMGTPVRLRILATGQQASGSIARRSPTADAATRTVHIEIDLPNGDRSLPVNTTAEISIDVGALVAAAEIPLTAANVRGSRANVFVVENGVAHARTVRVLGERGGNLFVGEGLAPGALVVTEGRALLADGDRVAAQRIPPEAPGAAQEHAQ